MFDGMSMPVLFVVLILTLALVSGGVLVAIRILAAHDAPRRPAPADRANEPDQLYPGWSQAADRAR